MASPEENTVGVGIGGGDAFGVEVTAFAPGNGGRNTEAGSPSGGGAEGCRELEERASAESGHRRPSRRDSKVSQNCLVLRASAYFDAVTWQVAPLLFCAWGVFGGVDELADFGFLFVDVAEVLGAEALVDFELLLAASFVAGANVGLA